MSRVDRSALPSTEAAPAFRFPRLERRVLDNGLEVRALAHHAVPVVSLVLLLPGGSSADPADRPGLAALTADLVDEGSGGRDALEVADRLARLGADLDIDVTADATVISMTTLARFLEPALEMLGEIVMAPTLADEDFARVRGLRLDRLRQLRDHAPAVAERAFARIIYGDHPYGHLSIGTEAALGAMTAADVRAFHQRAYIPQGTTLVMAGDARHADLLEAGVRAFAAWPSGALPLDRTAALAAPPLVPAERLAIVPRPGAAQSELRIGHLCASRDTPDYHALLLLNTVLGGQFVSRVNLNLREDKGYTYGARTGIDLRRGLGPFVLQMSVQTEVTAAAITEALREIDLIRGAKPVTDLERDLAVRSLTLGYPRGFETAQQVARSVAQLALHGLPDSYFEAFVPAISDVGLADLTRVARHYLDPSRLVTLIVGDHESIAGSLRSLNLGEPAVLGV
ncbi:MAG: pitrilysin family protein [Vicinamibacterales bacterium]|nr:pitrilysin family protein [Vicinamibacterales bacterium]